MKKIAMIFGAIALTFSLASCDEENKKGPDGPNFDDVKEDGFYVAGAATGATELTADYMMAAGRNEAASNEVRNGMYEKYIVLEGGKDFELVLYSAGSETRYSAVLADFDVTELSDNPPIVVKRGELKTGADAPAMQVAETGLYHIVLDLNNNEDLLYPQIIVAPVQWGVRGGMNGWGFTAFPEVTYSNAGMTWVLEDQELAAGGKFKFAYGGGWKIQLDDAGNVKANTNLGEGAVPGAADIAVEKAGTYKITLNFNLKGGAIENCYSYDVELTKESSMPTTMYVIGNEFGNWDWNADSVVEMTPVNGATGIFWAVRYMTTSTEFKFCAKREWNGDFCTLGENTGFVTPNNNQVEADGLYLIYVDVNGAGKVSVTPANVCALGDAFGGWDATNGGQLPMTVNADGTASATATASGVLRAFAKIEGVDAWKSEFSALDGKIVYRGNAGDFSADNAVTLSAGQTVTFNFNAGTATIQ